MDKVIAGQEHRRAYLSPQICNIIRGGAALAVLISHLPRVTPLPGKPLHPLGYLGVSLFLMLSGYGCSISLRKRTDGFLRKRVSKIVPELAGVVLIMTILMYTIKSASYPISEVLLNMLGLSSTILKVTWYIPFQYVCYVFLYAVSRYMPKIQLIAMIILSCTVLVISCFIQKDYIGLDMWGLNAFSFTVGCFCAEKSERIRNLKIKAKNMAIVILSVFFAVMFILCYFTLGNPKELYICNPMKSVIAASFCMTVFLIAETYENWFEKHLRVIGLVGVVSYEMYLIHGSIIYCFPEFFQLSNAWIMMIAFIALVMFHAWMLHKLFYVLKH